MWYVVQVTTGNEESMKEKCRRALSVEVCSSVFALKYNQMKKFKDGWHVEQKILFPGYLFLDTDKPDEVEEQLSVFQSLAKPVCIGGGFYPIREEEEAFLKDMIDEHYIVQSSVGYLVDNVLVVTEGPLCHLADQVKRIDRHKRIAELSVALWGSERKVLVGLEVVARVTAQEFAGMSK